VVEEKKGEVKGKDEGEEGKKKLKEGDEEQIERGREVGGESLWLRAVSLVLDTLQDQQAGTVEELPSLPPSFPPSHPPSDTPPLAFSSSSSSSPPYTFRRTTTVGSETLWGGRGEGGVAQRCGLVKSPFRPSDDASLLPFHVPSNAMVSMELKGVGRMILGGGWEGGREGEREGLGRRCMAMGEEIGTAVEEEGVIWVKRRKGGSKGNVDVVEEEEEEEGSGDEGRGGGGGGGVGGGCPMGDVESIYAYEVRKKEGGRVGGREGGIRMLASDACSRQHGYSHPLPSLSPSFPPSAGRWLWIILPGR